MKEKSPISVEDIKLFGKLSSKEALLGQLVGTIASPLRQLLCVLQKYAEKNEKVVDA